MMNIPLVQPARVNVHKELENKNCGSIRHQNQHWDEIPIPELELLMAPRYEIEARNVENQQSFDGCLPLTISELYALHSPQIIQALDQEALSNEEIPNVDGQDRDSKQIYEPFCTIELLIQELPIYRVRKVGTNFLVRGVASE